MAHPQMFDDDDPVLARVRENALSLPGAAMKISHGRPAFYTTKVFCYYGASVKVDGEWLQHPCALVVLAEPGEQEALRQDPRSFVPAYLGPYGWTGIDLDADTDWTEVVELLEESYRLTAPKRLVAQLDPRTGP